MAEVVNSIAIFITVLIATAQHVQMMRTLQTLHGQLEPRTFLHISILAGPSCRNPAEALYLVEGAGQVDLGLSWGDGFAHHQSLLAAGNVSDPSAFFRSLVRPASSPGRHCRTCSTPPLQPQNET